MRTMKWIVPTACLAILAGCAGTMSTGGGGKAAVADLYDATGKASGRAIVTESQDGLWLEVAASNISPGLHGLHVHAVGKCDAPEFTTATGHWNPTGHQHGHKNPKGPHAGDAPNLLADASGKGRLKTWLDAGTISAGASALLDADGASVIVHAGPDDEMSDPAGNSGKRVLCGVLRPR